MDFGIGKRIYIIIEKHENPHFYFANPSRQHAGFVLFTSGEGVVKDSNDNKYPVKRGSILLLPGGMKYEMYFKGACSYITSAFDFEAEDKSFLSRFPFVFNCSEKQIGAITEICEIWQSRKWDSAIECRIKLLSFYLDILKNQNKLSPDYDKDIHLALKFIRENFRRNFSSEEIAEYCSLSPSYLRAKFLKTTGKTVTAYRDSIRLSSACEMLESGHFSISEISAELGFCDVYHFSKFFKRYMEMSPSSYKKSLV